MDIHRVDAASNRVLLPQEDLIPFAFSAHISSIVSIEEIKQDSLFRRLVTFPIRIFQLVWYSLKRFVGNYLLCCFPSCRDALDWKEAKKEFSLIQSVVLSPEKFASSKDRKARFSEALAKLSDEALEKFKEHIGMSRAAMAKKGMSASQKKKWYAEHKEDIKFKEDYFDSIEGNEILEKGVESFWKEIQKHA